MINVYAPINHLGYGIFSQNIIKTLMDKNVDINLTVIGQVQNDPYFEPYWKRTSNESNKLNYNSKNPSLFLFHDDDDKNYLHF